MRVVLTVPAVLFLGLGGCLAPRCAERIVEERRANVRGPRAVIIETDCGAVSSLRFDVALLRSGEAPRSAFGGMRSVFALQDVQRPIDAPIERLRLEWLSDDSLLVTYDHRLRVVKRADESKHINVVYKTW